MKERFDIDPMDAEEDFIELSKDLEQAWRIVTTPQNHSRYKVRKAENLLDKTKLKILNSLTMETTDEEFSMCNDLMLGFYHYNGVLMIPNPPEKANLN